MRFRLGFAFAGFGFLAVFGFYVPFSATAIAAEAPVHPDFALQGEYRGLVDGRPMGLQVLALGDGKFQAVLHEGGLPGDGSDGKSPVRVDVSRSDDRLSFACLVAGDELSISLDGTSAAVSDAKGARVGTLDKTHRESPTLGVAPPWGATKLFDGNSAWHFKGGRITADGLLMEGTELKTAYRDFMLHLEFQLPFMPTARGQARGNSGVYLQSRYEVQILDSFGLDGAFNECGSLYRTQAPDLNMCFPPLAWQTYDIDFRAARFDRQGKKTANAVITVWHNGVKIHDRFELPNKTGAGQQESSASITTKLQNHNDPVRFRNIWIIDRNAPVPDPSAHPEFLDWSPELYKTGAFQGIRQPGPIVVPHVNIHGFVR